MKINIDLNKPITDLKGNAIAEAKASEVLVECLLQQTEGAPLKLLSICQSLDAKGTASLSPDDYNMITSLVEKNQRLTVLAKARILEMMEIGRTAAIPQPN